MRPESDEDLSYLTGDWRLLQKPANGQPGKVEKVRTYKLTPGVAHLYPDDVLLHLRPTEAGVKRKYGHENTGN